MMVCPSQCEKSSEHMNHPLLNELHCSKVASIAPPGNGGVNDNSASTILIIHSQIQIQIKRA